MAAAPGASGVRAVATPVAVEVSLCREAARASALAAHSAAGLCASAQLRAAARLLRSAEALSRAAGAALGACVRAQSTTLGAADAPMSGQAAGQTRRRRRRKKAGKNAGSQAAGAALGSQAAGADAMDDGKGEVGTSGAFGGCASSPPEPLVAVAAKPRRVLAAKTSRERSPRRVADQFHSPSTSTNTGAMASAADDVFTKGSIVMLSGLASRPELNGVQATVLSFDDVGGRYAVKLSTGDDIRVRAANMEPIFGPSLASEEVRRWRRQNDCVS